MQYTGRSRRRENFNDRLICGSGRAIAKSMLAGNELLRRLFGSACAGISAKGTSYQRRRGGGKQTWRNSARVYLREEKLERRQNNAKKEAFAAHPRESTDPKHRGVPPSLKTHATFSVTRKQTQEKHETPMCARDRWLKTPSRGAASVGASVSLMCARQIGGPMDWPARDP